MSNRLILAAGLFAAAIFSSVTGVQAGALDELIAIEESSQEAVVAPSEEEAKELSGEGFDTPSTSSDDEDE